MQRPFGGVRMSSEFYVNIKLSLFPLVIFRSSMLVFHVNITTQIPLLSKCICIFFFTYCTFR